jgi:SAM-dependent methyltransferase
MDNMLDTQSRLGCTNCKQGALQSTGSHVLLGDLLHNWEIQLSRPFSTEVWSDYRDIAYNPITLCECDRCGFQVFVPIVTGTESFYREIASTNYYVSAKWEFRRAVKDLQYRNVSKVLDVGCGTGEFLIFLRATSGIVGAGFDFNPTVVVELSKRGFCGLSSLDDPNVRQTFDAITVFQVIEHVADAHALFDQLDRLLKKSGIYVVAVPDTDGPVRFFRGALTDNPPHHVTRWRRSALTAFAQTRHYRVKYITTEWLPRYLWEMYLPVILAGMKLPFGIGPRLNRSGATNAFLRLLLATPLQELPFVAGHSLYAVFERV